LEERRPHWELDTVDGRASEAEHRPEAGVEGGREVERGCRRFLKSGELFGRERDLE